MALWPTKGAYSTVSITLRYWGKLTYNIAACNCIFYLRVDQVGEEGDAFFEEAVMRT